MQNKYLAKRALVLGCAALVTTTSVPFQNLGITNFSEENIMAATSTISSLKELKEACRNGGTYTVKESFAVDEKLVVKKNLTLKGSSSIIIKTSKSINYMFEVETGKTLTLDGGIVIKGGVNESYYTQKAVIYANPESKINIKNAKVCKSAGHAIYLKDAILNFSDGSITDNECRYGGNEDEQHGGAIFAAGTSTINMTGGSINNNKYGGVYLTKNATMYMSEGKINSNNGGAGNVDSNSNDHYGYGGAVYCNGTFSMTGGTISKNQASKDGYGIAIATSGIVNLSSNAVVNGVGSDANDIYIYGNGKLNINSKLSKNVQLAFAEYSNGKTAVSSATLTGEEIASFVNIKKDGWHLKPEEKSVTLSQKLYVTFIDTNTNESVKSDPIYYNDLCNMIEKERVGYILAGWTLKEGSSSADYELGSSVIVKENTTLYTVWVPKKIALNYNWNGGTYGPNSTSYTYDEGFKVSEITPVREGYDFQGWYLTEDFSGTCYQPTSSENIKLSTDEDVTLYAKWSPKKIDITFNDNIANEDIIVPNKINTSYDETVEYENLTAPIRIGYEFKGWNTKSDYTGKCFSTNFNTAELGTYGDITLYAEWKEKNINIQYKDDQGITFTTDNINYTDSKSVISPSEKTGYTFVGWYTEEDGKGTQVKTISPSKNKNDNDIVLYAFYEEKKIGVTFELNGGSSSTKSIEPIAYTKAVSEGFLLPVVDPKKAGYTFAGWYNNASFTGECFNSGQILKNDSSNEKDIVLYAKWNVNEKNDNPSVFEDPIPGSETTNNIDLAIKSSSIKLGVGEECSLKATSSSNGIYTYTSSNLDVATVSTSGKITAKKSGTATITVSIEGVSKSCKVAVYKAPTKSSLKLSATKKTLKKGKTYKIKTSFKKGYYCSKLTFSSNNKKVATVSSNGKITAKKKGKATITVKTFNGKKKKIQITVK